MQVIHTDKAPSHVGPVPQAVEAGGWIYVSALFGADAVDRVIPDDAAAEANVLFDNLVAILAAAGAELTDVVRVGIVMRDLQRDRPTFNAVWAKRFGGVSLMARPSGAENRDYPRYPRKTGLPCAAVSQFLPILW